MNATYQLPSIQPKVTWGVSVSLRDKIEALQEELLKMPQADVKTLQ